MCRCTDEYDGQGQGAYQKQQTRRPVLKIKSISLSLTSSSSSTTKLVDLPESLTLVFLPRINFNFNFNNATPLHINGSKVPPDSPHYLTLHRTSPTRETVTSFLFSSTDRLRASDSLSFEVHLGHHRLLSSILFFRHDVSRWSMDCKCVLDTDVILSVTEADLSVSIDGGAETEVLKETVSVAAAGRRRRRRRCRQQFKACLEEIPEERDRDVIDDDDVCCCCCSDDSSESRSDEYGDDVIDDDDDDDDDVNNHHREEEELEGVGWAVDVGFWVMCVGVGFLVHRASAKRFRRRKPSFLF